MEDVLEYCSNCGTPLSTDEYLAAGITPLCDDCKEVVDIPTCKLCGGYLMYTGTLGLMSWFRCRDCGQDFWSWKEKQNAEG